MLSYQHGFHAGNFADVLKHLVLTHVIEYLVQKEKPLLYLDTHAGRGCYDLSLTMSQKTAEFKQGIDKLWAARHTLGAEFKPYISCLKKANALALSNQHSQSQTDGDKLRFYPGSPWLASLLLRPTDRVIACELHPKEYRHLQEDTKPRCSNLHVKHEDGMHALKVYLPPKERRGIILIDPAYEIKTEYRDIPLKIEDAYKRFETGVYCLWYPWVDMRHTDSLLKRMEKISSKYLRVELYVKKNPSVGMWGCGMWIINPPYVLKEALHRMLPVVCQLLTTEKGTSPLSAEPIIESAHYVIT